MKIKNNDRNIIKKDIMKLTIIFFVIIIIFKIMLHKTPIAFIFVTLLKMFFFLILPGYFILLYKIKTLNFGERLVIGIVINLAILGILSYYLSVFGLSLEYHKYTLQFLIILIGFIAYKFKN